MASSSCGPTCGCSASRRWAEAAGGARRGPLRQPRQHLPCLALCAGRGRTARALERRPCVVMAHGFGATRDASLAPYAERFAAAGMHVLLFDYRHFGTSEGQPRQLVSVRRQLPGLRRGRRVCPRAQRRRSGAGRGVGHVVLRWTRARDCRARAGRRRGDLPVPDDGRPGGRATHPRVRRSLAAAAAHWPRPARPRARTLRPRALPVDGRPARQPRRHEQRRRRVGLPGAAAAGRATGRGGAHRAIRRLLPTREPRPPRALPGARAGLRTRQRRARRGRRARHCRTRCAAPRSGAIRSATSSRTSASTSNAASPTSSSSCARASHPDRPTPGARAHQPLKKLPSAKSQSRFR